MTERWQAELERLERLHPDEGLLERARLRPREALPPEARGRRFGAILVAAILMVGLSVGGYLVVDARPPRGGSNVATLPGHVENGDFLFAKGTDRGWSVFSLNPDTGQERQLTDGIRDYDSDWSPDGTRIVYDHEGDAGYEIVVANADGSHPVAIATGVSPSWSPDGTRIAFVGEDKRIWVVGADGSDAHPITDGSAEAEEAANTRPGSDWNPAWSPDGRSIAYTRLVSERLAPVPNGEGRTSVTLEELRVWSEDGSDVALTDAYTFLGDPDWSPDGSTIVFTGAPTLFHEDETNGTAWPRVLTIPSSGGKATAITPERHRWIGGATWSPDGERIAFQDDYETIALVHPDGSGRTEIDIGYEVIGLSWGVAPPTDA